MGRRALGSSLLAASLAFGQGTPKKDRAVKVVPAAVTGESRVALVIGNGAYRDSPLKNPPGDARAMASALKGCGFDVTLAVDADRRQMYEAIRGFGQKIANGGVGLFYFAGHGIAMNGSNYLIPVRTEIESEDEVPVQALDANAVLGKMNAAKNRLNILVLDACRNNPFAKGWRSGTRGLTQMEAPTGSFVAFATAPGSTASDGTGQNGLYTQALLEALRRPGLKVEEVFKQVRVAVKRQSGDLQVPWDSSSLTGDFFFRPQAGIPEPAPAPGLGAAPAVGAMVGGLQVAVNIPESKVFVDGAPRGTASPSEPLQIRDLPVGAVTVKVEAPGCQPREVQAEIQEGQWALAKVVLVRQPPPAAPAPAVQAPAPKTGAGYLGIALQNLDAELQTSLGVKEGVLVADLIPAGPAQKAGVQRLDVVTAVNGTPVKTGEEMVAQVTRGAIGATVTLTLWRDGSQRTLEAVLGERPPMPASAIDLEKVYGFTVEAPPAAATRVRVAVPVAAGVIVKTVTAGSGAATKGLEAGHIIVGVGTAEVKDLAGFTQEVAKAGGKPLLLRVKQTQAGGASILAIPPR